MRIWRCCAWHICNLNYTVPKKVPIVFHNGSNCDCHFMIKELDEEFKKQFTCFRRKSCKIHSLYSFNRKRNFKNYLKWRRN